MDVLLMFTRDGRSINTIEITKTPVIEAGDLYIQSFTSDNFDSDKKTWVWLGKDNGRLRLIGKTPSFVIYELDNLSHLAKDFENSPFTHLSQPNGSNTFWYKVV